MIRLPLATVSVLAASLLGLVALAAPARADDVRFDFGFGFRDGHTPRGFFGVDVRVPIRVDRPVRVIEPAPYPRDRGFERDACAPRREYLPPHMEYRQETVCEPAVYEDRCVPVFEDRCIPIFEEVCVPVYEQRRVAIYEWVVDTRTGHRRKVVVGQRIEQVKIGDRTERVKVGDRHEQVEVGTRMERVLVRAETTRVVTREQWIPGRYVMVLPDARRDGLRGERHEDGRRENGSNEARSPDRGFGDRRFEAPAGRASDAVAGESLSEAEYARLVREAETAPRDARR